MRKLICSEKFCYTFFDLFEIKLGSKPACLISWILNLCCSPHEKRKKKKGFSDLKSVWNWSQFFAQHSSAYSRIWEVNMIKKKKISEENFFFQFICQEEICWLIKIKAEDLGSLIARVFLGVRLQNFRLLNLHAVSNIFPAIVNFSLDQFLLKILDSRY